ncbi:GMC oxidoreductase [Hortaea werneckii]|nr:GMC oxidoreductase [Hortaea werneckii]KAI7707591.1 GMC oxidoreductase [Hortaea werneckii]
MDSQRHEPAGSLLAIWNAFILLLSGVQALDYQFNQQAPSGEPLISSFFGVPGTNATFDYVVVGGGTAGLTIATRLAAANLSVAVIEAGGFYELDNSNLSVVPGYATYFTGSAPDNFQPLVDWAIATTEQKVPMQCGSSARNYFLYHRPTVDSMQQWADLVGDQSWAWDKLLPYYKKSVHYTPINESMYTNSSNPQDPEAFLPEGGPLEVSYSNAVDPFGTWIRKAFADVGLPQINGLSSGHLLGAAYAPFTIDPQTGYRSSSESAYLQSALNRHSAPIIYHGTLATEILFDGEKATGVKALTAGTYGRPGKNYTLSARKEVILSAGAFQSPQLLMVSGIGNCTELVDLGIDCKVNLPGVGQNMWDHPIFGSTHAVNVNTASTSLNNATLAAILKQVYLESGGGPLSTFGPGYYGWEKLPKGYREHLSSSSVAALDSNFPPDWPEIEWLPQGGYSGRALNKQEADPRDGRNYATLATALVAPLSRGTVKLASPYMWDLPLVNPAWLTNEADIALSVQAFRRGRQIWQVLVDMGVAHQAEVYPGLNVSSDAEIRDYIAYASSTVYHAACTCKMGKSSDKMAVVDSSACVYGVRGLRVVDASAFPILPPGHPQSTIYAFAEKIAHSIITGG